MSGRPTKSPRFIRSNTTDLSGKECKEMNCKLAYRLQQTNIELHEAEQTRTKELIKCFSKFKSELQKWKGKWSSFSTGKQAGTTEYESIWDIFDASVLCVDEYIADITNSIENLTEVQETLPDLVKDDNLKAKMKAARERLNELEGKNEQLKKENKALDKQLQQSQKSTSQRSWSCIKPEGESTDLLQRQLSLDSQVKKMQSSIKKEKAAFCQKQKELYEEFKQSEIKRWEMLKNQSDRLVEALSIEDEALNDLLKTYKAADDFAEWDRNIFRPDSKKTEPSQSPGSATVESPR